jgi:glycosyltransferase involved in cell wall biosynthesis
MSKHPIISVVICTYNNADSLAITLQQLSQQVVKCKEHVEVILVDNNSPDHTKKIYQEFSKHSPLVNNYFFEGRQGLSHARNTGVTNAQGEYILFTDDDADIPTNWLESYLLEIEESRPDCLYSRITIIWDKQKPWRFLPEYTSCFVGVDYGNLPIVVTDIHREFYGKNFCMKKSLLLELGGFDPALGRSGSKLIAGEETLLYRKMVEQKKHLLYFPNAPVGHRLKEREYLAENIKKQFIDGAYSSHHIAKIMAKKRIFGRPLRALIDSITALTKSSLLYVRYLVERRRPEHYYHYLNIMKNATLIKLWILSK